MYFCCDQPKKDYDNPFGFSYLFNLWIKDVFSPLSRDEELIFFVITMLLTFYFLFTAYLVWLCWAFVAVSRLSLVAAAVPGFSLQWLRLFWSTGSRQCGLQELWLLGSRVQAQ